MWSAVASGIGAIASHINQAWAQHHSAKEARKADTRAYENWKNSFEYQNLEGSLLMRKGLENAGFNPLLAVNGGMSMSSGQSFSGHQGQSFIPDTVGSARQGAELARDLTKMFGEQVEQAETKTKADKKGLSVIDAQKKKIETETDLMKSQEIRNWVDSTGGVIGDGIDGLILWNLLNDRRKRNSVFTRKGARNLGSSRSSSSSSGGDSLLPMLAPLIFGGVKGAGIGLGIHGLGEAFKRTNHEVNENMRRRDGWYTHGNWSR